MLTGIGSHLLIGVADEPHKKLLREKLAPVKRYPNPPAPNITQFR